VYHVDFDSQNRTRSLTVFGDEYKKIIANNGFVSNQEVTPLIPSGLEYIATDTIDSSFEALEPSSIPSEAAQEIWKVIQFSTKMCILEEKKKLLEKNCCFRTTRIKITLYHF